MELKADVTLKCRVASVLGRGGAAVLEYRGDVSSVRVPWYKDGLFFFFLSLVVREPEKGRECRDKMGSEVCLRCRVVAGIMDSVEQVS